MDLDTILKIVALGTQHQYLAIAVLVIGWLTAMTSDWSKFPINVPGRWQPAVVAGLGLVYGVLSHLQDGMRWQDVLMSGLLAAATSGFLFDVVIKGVFNGNVPSWLAWLAFAQDHKNAPEVKAAKSLPPPAGPKNLG